MSLIAFQKQCGSTPRPTVCYSWHASMTFPAFSFRFRFRHSLPRVTDNTRAIMSAHGRRAAATFTSRGLDDAGIFRFSGMNGEYRAWAICPWHCSLSPTVNIRAADFANYREAEKDRREHLGELKGRASSVWNSSPKWSIFLSNVPNVVTERKLFSFIYYSIYILINLTQLWLSKLVSRRATLSRRVIFF